MTAGWSRVAASCFCAAAALSLAGCALLAAPPPQPSKQVLAKMPPEVPQRTSNGAVLVVYPPQTRPVYDTTEMAYMTRPYEIAYFSQHEWAEPPAQMLQPLLVATLQNTHLFSAVLTPPYAGRHSYALRTEIRELIADFTSEPAALKLSLRFQLSEGATGSVVATQDVSIREPLQQKTPYAGVVAGNDATAKALLELARFVLEKAD
ncbi:MAG TPA: ABC-type transport auxiliary lipoprotein family protein [Ramlibacter sp.]|nr:ABC-type transport auxiliary lipoprotein family protein [Ramlibacter sp.]